MTRFCISSVQAELNQKEALTFSLPPRRRMRAALPSLALRLVGPTVGLQVRRRLRRPTSVETSIQSLGQTTVENILDVLNYEIYSDYVQGKKKLAMTVY